MLIRDVIAQKVQDALAQTEYPAKTPVQTALEHPQNPEHGDYATSLPLRLSRSWGINPLKIAQNIASLVKCGDELESVNAAPPGFVNFSLKLGWLQEQVDSIISAGEHYGEVNDGQGQRVQVEFVSVNPTGPIHVGHTRGAILGSAMAKLLQTAGYEVSCEYYINDAGNQMNLFYESLYARYKQEFGQESDFPTDGYLGTYIRTLAKEIKTEFGRHFLDLPEGEGSIQLGKLGLQKMLAYIRKDLESIGVRFDVWFSESDLYTSGQYEKILAMLHDGGYLVQRDGATWFSSEILGEDKDAVLVRSTGIPTYFASDVAYHYNKLKVRKFDRAVNIWGADHQGHVGRVKAAIAALGLDQSRLHIAITQMVSLKRGSEAVRVSKRTGELITLRDLVDDVGSDACRFLFLARSPEAQMEFDMELAVHQSMDNPVYYVQYAHARIAGILRQARERGISYLEGDVRLLTGTEEQGLVRMLLRLPELVQDAARTLEPHRLPHYSLELATSFHWFYDRTRVISDNLELTMARLKLVEASRIGLGRALALMGVNAPEHM